MRHVGANLRVAVFGTPQMTPTERAALAAFWLLALVGALYA